SGANQLAGGNDLVGVDVRPQEDRGGTGDANKLLHRACLQCAILRASAMLPATAEAATVAGLARWVRAPGPCRPSKLRLVVLTTRSPAKVSPPMNAQSEQPDSRHSNPASVKTRSRPSASASRLTRVEPGTQIARTPAATLRPRSTSAAARKSDSRLLVQEPMNAAVIGTPSSGVPGVSPV